MHRRGQSTTSTLRQRRAKRGMRFNLMVVGSSGSGKSTFINTLSGKQLVSAAERDATGAEAAASHGGAGRERPVRLRTYTDEGGEFGPITVKYIETAGFGENLDAGATLRDILSYIETQYDEKLAEETRIRRNPRVVDNRVHALVYLVEATGHGLRELDIELMRLIGPRVNLIPALSKADGLTRAEVELNKRLVREDIERYALPVYQFNRGEQDGENVDDDGYADAQSTPAVSEESLPFALIGSNTSVATEDGRPVLARQYPWGSVLVEDPRVSDFALLRDVLLYSHQDDLRETTEDFLYESYRTQQLSQAGQRDGGPGLGPVQSADGSASDAYALHRGAGPDNSYGGDLSLASASSVPSSRAGPGAAGANGVVAGVSSGSAAGGNRAHIAREDQLRLEEEKLHRDEYSVQRELELKRQELARREQELRELEARLKQEAQALNSPVASETAQF